MIEKMNLGSCTADGFSTVHAALKALAEKGIVESEPNGYFVGDPFFARYVRT